MAFRSLDALLEEAKKLGDASRTLPDDDEAAVLAHAAKVRAVAAALTLAVQRDIKQRGDAERCPRN